MRKKNKMNFPCEQCENGRAKCEKCYIKHSRYCEEHLKDNSMFQSVQKNVSHGPYCLVESKVMFYCKTCYHSFLCKRKNCSKGTDVCRKCKKDLQTCAYHCTLKNYLGDIVCDNCYSKRNQNKCNNCETYSYVKGECSNCKQPYCDKCTK